MARWLDLGSWEPITRDQLLAEKVSTIPDWPDSPVFTELERLVMLYAEVMTVAPALVTDDLVARLRRNLGDAELVELTALIADESLRSWVGGLDRRGPGIAG